MVNSYKEEASVPIGRVWPTGLRPGLRRRWKLYYLLAVPVTPGTPRVPEPAPSPSRKVETRPHWTPRPSRSSRWLPHLRLRVWLRVRLRRRQRLRRRLPRRGWRRSAHFLHLRLRTPRRYLAVTAAARRPRRRPAPRRTRPNLPGTSPQHLPLSQHLLLAPPLCLLLALPLTLLLPLELTRLEDL